MLLTTCILFNVYADNNTPQITEQEIPKFEITMLKINEVRSAGVFDFIEIYNTAPFAVQFPKGWYILDSKQDYSEAIPIPEGVVIKSKGFLVIIPDQASVSISLPADVPIIYATESHNFGLNAGDEVRLMYNNNFQEILVDILGWGGAANSWGYFPDGSIELYDSLIPTPGSKNKPYPVPEIKPTLRLNEIQTKECSYCPHDYIELYNYGSNPISGKGISVLDESGSPGLHLPSDLIIQPGEYIVLFPDEYDPCLDMNENVILNSSPDNTFGLGKSDSVFLNYLGTVIDSYSWEDGHHTSIGLMGIDNLIWETGLLPTPGEENKRRF